ncbi:MAG: hypothetical protein HGB30_08005 [Holophagaceae bacterium]|nr:hypothetical protein [Holophagaceae bacterium]
MSFQSLAALALSAAAALWFLRGLLRELRPVEDCASGCGTCASGCPFQAPAPPTDGKRLRISSGA